ncbi:MAG: hypothetical protein K6T30_00655, partial [Alicyclobacillus sp.]|nr:hypothetical protein [Alicyclobacillus sp.]
PFEEAVSQLRQAAGAALDPEVVEAFLTWFERVGHSNETLPGALGPCHQLCCVPEAICEGCPARKTPLRCWEIPGNHCSAHGRSCETCFVRTEAEFRAKQQVNAAGGVSQVPAGGPVAL